MAVLEYSVPVPWYSVPVQGYSVPVILGQVFLFMDICSVTVLGYSVPVLVQVFLF